MPSKPASLPVLYREHRHVFSLFIPTSFHGLLVLPVSLAAFCSRAFFLKTKFLNHSYQQGDRLHAEHLEAKYWKLRLFNLKVDWIILKERGEFFVCLFCVFLFTGL
jgi:hypothetical protein